MSAVEGSYSNLLQGVSQQPQEQRKEGQCEAQVNMTADPVGNLKKRPPLRYISKLTGTRNPEEVVHFEYTRGGENSYICSIDKDGEVEVVDIQGKVYEVVNSCQEYLSTNNPSLNLKATNIQDFTVLCNTTVTVKMTEDTEVGQTSEGVLKDVPFPDDELIQEYAYVEVISSTWSTEFSVVVRNKASGAEFKASYRTPTGVDEPEDEAPLATAKHVAKTLQEQLEGFNVPVYRFEGLLAIGTSNVEVVSVDDSNGGSFVRVCTGVLKDIKNLPSRAMNGEVVKIQPVDQTNDSVYYLKYKADNTHFGSGVWEESAKVGIKTTLDSSTLPVVMVRLQKENGDIYFNVNQVDGSDLLNFNGTYTLPKYGVRDVGDEDSNPTPSFVGNVISTLGVYQNRLYFVSQDNITFSSSDSYWRFWYGSATVVTDSDVIDIGTGVTSTSPIKQTATQDNDLVLFTDNDQYIMFGDKVLTPSTAFVAPVTSFEASTKTAPLSSGRNIYFPVKYGKYSGVRVLQTDAVSATRDAPPITSHVSNYIQGEVVGITSSDIAGQMFLHTDSVGQDIYLYEYFWSGNKIVQSAWSKWELPSNMYPSYLFCLETTLYVVAYNTQIEEGFLLSVDLEDSLVTSFGFNIYLDFLVELDVDENNTVTIPYDYTDIHFVQSVGCPNEGMLAGKLKKSSYLSEPYQHTFDEDYSGGKVFAGIPYRASYVPTDPQVRDSRGIPMSQGELRLNRYILTYKDSGYLEATLYSRYLEAVTGTLAGRIVSDDKNLVGTAPLIEGTVSIPVLQSPSNCTVEIHSDDYKPIRLVALEWEGSFSQGKRRL